MVQQQAIRETVTEEGITKKAREIKQVFLSIYKNPRSYFINDFLTQVHHTSFTLEQVVHLLDLITWEGLEAGGLAKHSALMALLTKVQNVLN